VLRARSTDRQRGQASVELIALLPLLLAAAAVLWQLVLAGHAYWLCANAARVAARAALVGGVVDAAARSALPAPLERGLEVDAAGDGAVRVELRLPLLLPAWRLALPIVARARLGSPAADGGRSR
jgi:hypothetical protein